MQFNIHKSSRAMCSVFLVLAIVSCFFVGESMANKGNKGEDIILYNGNIVLRGGGKKGKGGSIVVANSPQMDMMPYFGGGGWGGFMRRRR